MLKKSLLILILVVTYASADWNFISSLFKKTVDAIAYTVETSGQNPRVYEFDTQGYPRMHCVVFLRPDTKTSPTMFCMRLTPEDAKKNAKLAK